MFRYLCFILVLEYAYSKYLSRTLGFKVTLNCRFTDMSSYIEKHIVKNRVGCAALCSATVSCCSANFETGTRECNLFSTCCLSNLKIQASTGKHALVKVDGVPSSGLLSCNGLAIGSSSGIYTIHLSSCTSLQVYCQVNGPNDAWALIQHRFDGSVNFQRDWNTYRDGFGSLSGEFWLGNENIHKITSSGTYKLRIELEDLLGTCVYAMYSSFSVKNEASEYELAVGGYSGTAGDGMKDGKGDPLSGWSFSTYDRDNDARTLLDCASVVKLSGWWHRDCTSSNLNGVYSLGIPLISSMYHDPFRGYVGLKTSRMMVQPA